MNAKNINEYQRLRSSRAALPWRACAVACAILCAAACWGGCGGGAQVVEVTEPWTSGDERVLGLEQDEPTEPTERATPEDD